jgi:hypothetical protein
MLLNLKDMYIVYYTTGSYDDFTRVPVFVTDNENKASDWVLKFNKIFDKWLDYYRKNRSELSFTMIEEIIYYKEVGKAYFEEIELR